MQAQFDLGEVSLPQRKYWMAAVSKEHTLRGVAGGFMQVCHGKQAPLKRIKKGDGMIVYSSKFSMEGNEKCQAFTAIGEASDEEVYPYQMTKSFRPYRRNFNFFESHDISILPLIERLNFIQNKKSWGFPFRFGFFEINNQDYNLIAQEMTIIRT